MEQQLNICFSTLFSLYLKTHRYHWLVKGTDFPQLHELFGDQYAAIWTTLDDFAERINFHHYIPASTYEDLQNLSAVKISTAIPAGLNMVKELAEDHSIAINNLNQLFKIVEQHDDQALMNFIADLLDQHQKHRWMLENIANVQAQLNDENTQDIDVGEDQEPVTIPPVNNVLGSVQGNHMRNLLDIFK